MSAAGSPYSYTLSIDNQGPDSADGTTFAFSLPVGSAGVIAECTEALGGAQCPDDISISATEVTGTLTTLPSDASLTIEVAGRYAAASSAAATLTASVPETVTDPDLSSNSAMQGTALQTEAAVTVTASQNVDEIRLNETVTYDVTFTNDGPAWLDRLDVHDSIQVIGAGLVEDPVTADIEVTCTATGGAVCPDWATVARSEYKLHHSERQIVSGLLALPALGSVTLSVQVTPTATVCSNSVSFVLHNKAHRVSQPGINFSGVASASTETTLADLELCPRAEILTTKTQDRSSVGLGETVTYQVAYTNNGPHSIPELEVSDIVKVTSSTGSFTADFAVSCTSSPGAFCPDWASSSTLGREVGKGGTRVYTDHISLPVDETIAFTIKMTPRTSECGPGGAITVTNSAIATSRSDFIITGTREAQTQTQLTGLEACPSADITLTSSQSRSAMAFGDTVTYTVHYANNDTHAVSALEVWDTVLLEGGAGSSNITAEVDLSCAATGGATCPDWATGTIANLPISSRGRSTYRGDLAVRPGEAVTLTATVRPTSLVCPTSGAIWLKHTAYRGTEDGILLSGPRAAQTGRVQMSCADVITNSTISTSTPEPGAILPLTTRIANAAGTATNVPVTIQLPAGGYTFNEAAGDTVTCEVLSGAPACPSDLSYDATAHSIRGLITSLPAGTELQFHVLGRAGVIPPTGGSYTISVTAPATADSEPASNNSNVVFGLANQRTTLTAAVYVSGGPLPGPAVFTGEVNCDSQGVFPFEVAIPTGSNLGEVTVSSTLWLRDNCRATLDALPDAPVGFAWGTPTDPPPVNEVLGPVRFLFEVPMTPPRPDEVTSARATVSVTPDTHDTELAFTGMLSCTAAGNMPVTVILPEEQATATTLISSGLMPGDECTMSISAPPAPPGFVWRMTEGETPV